MGGSPEPSKTWIIEWKKLFGKTVSEERCDYAEALRIFDEKTASGLDAILYEVRRSPVDLSVIKKTPILNSVKARRRKVEEPANSNNKDKLAETKPKRNSKAGNLKLRIVLLIAVIGALLLIISLITALTNRGGIIVYPHSAVSLFDTDATTTAVPFNTYREYSAFNTPI